MNPPRRAERPQPRAAAPPLHRIATNLALGFGSATFAAVRAGAGCGPSVELMADGSSQREATTDCGALAPGAVALLASPMAALAGIAGARPPLRRAGSRPVCRGQLGMGVGDRTLHRSRGCRRNRLCRSGGDSARRFAQAFRLPPGDTSNGAWWRDRCGNTNGCRRVFRRSEPARQSSAARAALERYGSERGACENTGDDCRDKFRSSVGHVPLR